MTELVTYRAAIVSGIDTKVPEFVTCSPIRGAFDSEEPDRIGQRSPAALLTLTDLNPAESQANMTLVTCQWALFVVTKEQLQLPRDVGALVLMNKVLQFLPTEKWGIQDVSSPEEISCVNIYSTTLDQKGANAWLIRWSQDALLEPFTNPADLEDFKVNAPDYYHYPMGQSPDFHDETDIP